MTDTIYLCIDVKSTGGCYRFLEFYLRFHLLTGQILAWHERRAWIMTLYVPLFFHFRFDIIN